MGKQTKNQKLVETVETVEDEASKKRKEKCEAVAEQMLQIMAKHAPAASITDEVENHQKMIDAYTPIYHDWLRIALKEEMTIPDITYAISILRTFTEYSARLFNMSAQQNIDSAEEKLWGKPKHELTLNDIDDILKAPIETTPEAE